MWEIDLERERERDRPEKGVREKIGWGREITREYECHTWVMNNCFVQYNIPINVINYQCFGLKTVKKNVNCFSFINKT